MLRPAGTIPCRSRDLFRETSWGRQVAALGFYRDLAMCAELDATDVVPLMQDARVTLGQSSHP